MIIVSVASSKWFSFKFPLVEMLFYRVRCAPLYSSVSVFGERNNVAERSLNKLLSTGKMCIVSLSSIYLGCGDYSDGELEKID